MREEGASLTWLLPGLKVEVFAALYFDEMWPGPYGDFGSKKYLVASLDQSLKRLGLDYVDIFTPIGPIRIHPWRRP